jgi:hypothetical protein
LTHLRPKLAKWVNLAKSDASIGLATIGVIYLGSTWVMLALIGVDWLLGTSLASGPDWILPTKLTAIAAFFVWGIFLYTPANILARFLEAPRDWVSSPWQSYLKRVRPMVGAIALCLGLYGGYLKLTRFRGHPRICVEGVRDAKQGKEASTIPA